MGADLFIADEQGTRIDDSGPSITFDDDGYYWFLYPYFETANLNRRFELVDLYGNSEIDGYQLERLRDELLEARLDVEKRADTWKVLVGWTGTTKSRTTEIWRSVYRTEFLDRIDHLLRLVDAARVGGRKLVVVGD